MPVKQCLEIVEARLIELKDERLGIKNEKDLKTHDDLIKISENFKAILKTNFRL